MLGWAGRPGQVSKGYGIVLIDRAHRAEAGDLVEAVRARRGGPVTSQLVGSFEKLMRFVLAVIVERGERAAHSLGRDDQAAAAHDASATLRYGVAPPVVPLMALGFPQLRRARARYLYDRGIRDVADLAGADPSQLADPRRVPFRYAADWIERARQIQEAALMSDADREEDPAEFDELVARFRLDPAAL
jgi:replicative superfamily II helicase